MPKENQEEDFTEKVKELKTSKIKYHAGSNGFCRNCEGQNIFEYRTLMEITKIPNPKVFGEKAKPQVYQKTITTKYACGDCHIENPEKSKVVKFISEEVHGIDCFIATVVYGDVNAPQVETLREFRDNVLIQSPAGSAVVNFYYSGAGKKIADFIKDHLPSAIPFIRKGLDHIVESCQEKNN